MTWNFETSFLAFLVVTFAAQAIATAVKSVIPMPLLLGIFCAIGFYTGFFPKDMMVLANMIAVGTIAFNVLVIHGGTLLDTRMIRAKWRDALTVAIPSLLLVPVCLLVLWPLFGREIALLAPGAAVGGGASCAIASRWVLEKAPAVSVFPWMLFMFQGLFCVPVVRWALKKESAILLSSLRAGKIQMPQGGPPPQNAPSGAVGRIPTAYKTTAYYLGGVMLISVLNKLLVSAIPGWTININVTALLLGFLLGRMGLVDRGPLFSSDSYGLLLLGLMGLFANTIANNTVGNLLRLVPAVLVTLAVSSAVLLCGGLLSAKLTKTSKWRAIALTMNCMMGFPVNKALVAEAAASGKNDGERGFLSSQIGPVLGMGTMLVSNALSILVVSFLVNLV